MNLGDDTPPGNTPYPRPRGAQDDPAQWRTDGAVVLRDGEVIAIAKDRWMAFLLAAVMRRFSHGRMRDDDDDTAGPAYVDEHAGDSPGPGVGGR